MDEQLNDYRPLCDMEGCHEKQGGVPFEGYIKSKYTSISFPVRIRPCPAHLSQLRNCAEQR